MKASWTKQNLYTKILPSPPTRRKNRWFSHNSQRQQKTKTGRPCWRSKQKKSSKFFCSKSTSIMTSSEDRLFRNAAPTKKLGGTRVGRVKSSIERNWFSCYLLNFCIGFSHDVVAYKLDGIFGNYLVFQGLRCDNNERILVLSNCSPQTVHQFRSERAFC